MTITLQLFGIIAGIALIIISLRSIVKRVITERQSLFWIFLGIIIIIFCMFPVMCTLIATVFGVEYPPSIIFMVAVIIVVFGLFYCFQKIAKLTGQVRDLAIRLTVCTKKLEELQKMTDENDHSDEEVKEELSENEKAAVHN